MTSEYCYRIYCEEVNLPETLAYVNTILDGYTIYKGLGCWKGSNEHTIIIEYITVGSLQNQVSVGCDSLLIREIAQGLKKLCKQEAVIITRHKIETECI